MPDDPRGKGVFAIVVAAAVCCGAVAVLGAAGVLGVSGGLLGSLELTVAAMVVAVGGLCWLTVVLWRNRS